MSVGIKEARVLLKTAGAAIRQQTQIIDELAQKLASYERDQRVTKIAQEMQDKGLNSEFSMEEKIAHLRTVKNLEVTEEAVKLASHQGILLGELSDRPAGTDSYNAFVTYINSGEDSD